MSQAPLDKDFANIFFKPIAKYLMNPDTSEVMVNRFDDVWVEDSKGMRKVPETFTLDSLEAAVQSLAQYIGRPIVENVFSIDARMPDGSRVCIMLPPVSGDSPAFSIRLFKGVISDLNYLVDKGTLMPEMVELISALVGIKKNMMVAGGTSSGKTTLLNLIAATIPNEDRIITIEDSKELQLKQDHILALEARPPDKHGKGEFTIRQCLKSTLRLRPDRIVVGEIRGGEAFDLIQAMNTGHGGCMGTIHANNALESLRRIESIALMADVDIPLVALRAMIASALDVIICPSKMIDRSRKVIQIAEVGPLTEKGDYQVFDIVRFVSQNYDHASGKLDGHFEFTGHVPTFFDMFAAEGIPIPESFFEARILGANGKKIASTAKKVAVPKMPVLSILSTPAPEKEIETEKEVEEIVEETFEEPEVTDDYSATALFEEVPEAETAQDEIEETQEDSYETFAEQEQETEQTELEEFPEAQEIEQAEQEEDPVAKFSLSNLSKPFPTKDDEKKERQGVQLRVNRKPSITDEPSEANKTPIAKEVNEEPKGNRPPLLDRLRAITQKHADEAKRKGNVVEDEDIQAQEFETFQSFSPQIEENTEENEEENTDEYSGITSSDMQFGLESSESPESEEMAFQSESQDEYQNEGEGEDENVEEDAQNETQFTLEENNFQDLEQEEIQEPRRQARPSIQTQSEPESSEEDFSKQNASTIADIIRRMKEKKNLANN